MNYSFLYKLILLIQPMLCYNLTPNKYQKIHQKKYNNLNNCITSLKTDIQMFPYYELDWSIYTPNVIFKDPTGFEQRGLFNYKQVFQIIRLFRKIAIKNVTISYNLKYIPESQKILVVWYSKWFINGINNPKYIDAISHFSLNEEGLIYKHYIEYMYSDEDVAIIKNIAQFISNIYDSQPQLAYGLQTCEYIWDCESPLDCCDFIFSKICCSKGVKIPNYIPNEPIPIPIPVEEPVKPNNLIK